jgi:hypothetical protein
MTPCARRDFQRIASMKQPTQFIHTVPDNFKGQTPTPTPTLCPKNQVALVQCWRCNHDEYRKVGIGRPEELRCTKCKGRVEVLEVKDEEFCQCPECAQKHRG